MRILLPALVLLLWTAGPCAAQTPASSPLQTITLNDGTVVKGHLVHADQNTYVIRSTQFGDVRVAADKVRSITTGNTAPVSGNQFSTLSGVMGGQSGFSSRVGTMQQRLLSDPQVMGEVQNLMKDPQVVRLLQNPQLMQAVSSMNPQQIQSNPAVQELLKNPGVQRIIQELGSQLTTPGR